MSLPDRLDQRAFALHDAVARLSRAQTRQDIGAVAIDVAFELMGAAVAVVYDDVGDKLKCIAHRGLPEAAQLLNVELPRDAPLPLATAIATAEPVWIERYEDLVERYPTTRGALTPVTKLQSVAALPFTSDGHAIGGMAMSFDQVRAFNVHERTFLLTLTEHVALALERLRLRNEEAAARHRLTVLAEASRRFTEARLDLNAVLEAVADEVTHRLRDSCAINLLSADRTVLEPAALHHVDPEAVESIRRTIASAPIRMDEPSAPARVATTGEPILVPVVPMESLLATVKPEYRAHLERFPIASLLVVPLRVHRDVIGTITVTRGPGQPPYSAQDQSLVQDLADRAAFAIANARLFLDARQAVELRDTFLSVAGHELNTPVAALLLQIQSVLKQADTLAIEPRLRERFTKMAGNVHRLGRLVTALLDVSRIAEGKLAIVKERIDLTAIVRGVVENLHLDAEAAGCEMVLELPPELVGSWDPMRLEQLVTNLLSNALKYGAGQPVVVSLSSVDRVVQLAIRDHGIGISPEDEGRIFLQFERAVSPRHYSGFGLGLWIARQIADGHGGRLWFERPEGRGARFVVELPH